MVILCRESVQNVYFLSFDLNGGFIEFKWWFFLILHCRYTSVAYLSIRCAPMLLSSQVKEQGVSSRRVLNYFADTHLAISIHVFVPILVNKGHGLLCRRLRILWLKVERLMLQLYTAAHSLKLWLTLLPFGNHTLVLIVALIFIEVAISWTINPIENLGVFAISLNYDRALWIHLNRILQTLQVLLCSKVVLGGANCQIFLKKLLV